MGNQFRKGMDKHTAILRGPIDAPEFLKESHKVSSMLVRPPKKLLEQYQQPQQRQVSESEL